MIVQRHHLVSTNLIGLFVLICNTWVSNIEHLCSTLYLFNY